MLGDIIACAVKFTGFDRHLIIVEYGNRYQSEFNFSCFFISLKWFSPTINNYRGSKPVTFGNLKTIDPEGPGTEIYVEPWAPSAFGYARDGD